MNLPFFFSRHLLLTMVILVVIIGGGATGRVVLAEPKVLHPTAPALGTTVVSQKRPLTIVFSHLLNQKSLAMAIHPDLPGSWQIKTHFWSDTTTVIFTPSVSPDFDTRYTVELNGIKGKFVGHPSNYLLSFQTETTPVFVSVTPANSATNVAPADPLIITFDKPIRDGQTVLISTVPPINLSAPVLHDKTVTFGHDVGWEKSTVYTVVASLTLARLNYATKTYTQTGDPIQLSTSTFQTVDAPGIATFDPTGTGVAATTAIHIAFKQVMDHPSTEQALSISPTAAGSFAWTDNTMTFTPSSPLTKSVVYTVTLAKSAKAVSGYTLDTDLTFSFTTIGNVAVSSSSPSNGRSGIDPGTDISLTFNQAVQHPSAESKFSISPTVAGTFGWNGNTVVFHPSTALAYNTTYTVNEAAGVATVSGLDSIAAFHSKFTTRNQTILLSVPSYRQAHMYSCMIAAARDAMAFRGVNVSESAIIARVGQDSTKWSGTWGGSNGVWGDPDSAMVGGLDNGAATGKLGSTNVYWGYGAHWGPVAKAITSFGVANEVHTGMTVQQLAQSVKDGNPVIIWWVNGIWPSYELHWKTPSGKTVRAVNGLHVQVVRGFTGSVDNPVSFTVTDSGYGYPGHTFDVGTFKAKWSWFGNTGIIIH